MHPFREWVERNNYTSTDYKILDVDSCGGTKLECANQAKSYIEATVDERFLLIGHSAGGDAAIITAARVADKGKFAGIVLLDPTLTATLEDGTTDISKMADDLPKPVFLGEGGDNIDISIPGADEITYR